MHVTYIAHIYVNKNERWSDIFLNLEFKVQVLVVYDPIQWLCYGQISGEKTQTGRTSFVSDTVWKVSVFRVILVHICPHSEWIYPNTDTFHAVWVISSYFPKALFKTNTAVVQIILSYLIYSENM